MEKITLKIVAQRLRDLAKENNLNVLHEKVLYFYSERYNGVSNELADFLCAVYGFRGFLPRPNPHKKKYFLNLLSK